MGFINISSNLMDDFRLLCPRHFMTGLTHVYITLELTDVIDIAKAYLWYLVKWITCDNERLHKCITWNFVKLLQIKLYLYIYLSIYLSFFFFFFTYYYYFFFSNYNEFRTNTRKTYIHRNARNFHTYFNQSFTSFTHYASNLLPNS